MEINNKPFALITGVAGGIGAALVRAFKEAGYIVIGTDLEPKTNIANIDFFFQINLEKLIEDEVASKLFYLQISKVLNGAGLKVLVNNAALQIIKPVSELTVIDIMRTLNTNTAAPFLLIQNFLTDLEQENGSVVNISSIHATLTKPNFVAYATSKAALSGLTRALSVELGHRVRINAIAPAAVATKMLKAGFENDKNGFEKLSKMHPVGRIGEPIEVADLAVFLSSEKAEFINGSIFELNGGIGNRLYDPS
jgi:NAD(P)-dependent dehydrogenase (short-subunit alcohol dehydrogenase family)